MRSLDHLKIVAYFDDVFRVVFRFAELKSERFELLHFFLHLGLEADIGALDYLPENSLGNVQDERFPFNTKAS